LKIKDEVSILLVDDDDVDIIGLKRAFKRRNIYNPVHRAKDGIEALEFLSSVDKTKSISKPYLIILDINMPRMNGIEFLEQLRSNSKHKDAIVFVLTTSQYDEDKIKAYSYNIAGYMTKSSFGEKTDKFLDIIESYLEIVDFPC
jgi:CheY-like chemotaxis protein